MKLLTSIPASLIPFLPLASFPGFPTWHPGPEDSGSQTGDPRVRVPEGSVGIAQRQTGIYPFQSPAGWRIIGLTEVSLFNDRKEPYSLMKIGDRVKFVKV